MGWGERLGYIVVRPSVRREQDLLSHRSTGAFPLAIGPGCGRFSLAPEAFSAFSLVVSVGGWLARVHAREPLSPISRAPTVAGRC